MELRYVDYFSVNGHKAALVAEGHKYSSVLVLDCPLRVVKAAPRKPVI